MALDLGAGPITTQCTCSNIDNSHEIGLLKFRPTWKKVLMGVQYSINDCFERNSCFYTLKGRLELCYYPRRAEGNSPIVTFPRAYKNNYFSNIKAVINTFICRKKID